MKGRARFLSAALAVSAAAACSDLSFTTAIDRISEPIAFPRFSRDIAPILEATCASSGACHSGPTPQKGLDLSPENAIDAIIDVRPTTVYPAAPYYVRPLYPDSSFLFRVLSTNVTYRFGYRRMPLTAIPLPDPVIETIRNWIEQGAPNN